MNGNSRKMLRIGVFYDGHYFFKVSNYYNYEHERKARISISGLHEFIRNEVAKETGHDAKLCHIVDAHYFSGRFSAQKADEIKNKLYNERVFDDILIRENVITHYLPLKYDKNGKPQEKGVDVWLALEAYELAIYKRFDVLVLVTCDGDYIPLVRKVHTVGSQVMLLSWDFEYVDADNNERHTRTAQSLLDEVSYPIAMHERINSRVKDSLIENMFFQPKASSKPLQSMIPDSACPTETKESTILSLHNNGFGFIEEKSIGNLFFHRESLVDFDFNDLKQGMRVKYTMRSKDDGKFFAEKVWVVL